MGLGGYGRLSKIKYLKLKGVAVGGRRKNNLGSDNRS